jgi:hypothetical protein
MDESLPKYGNRVWEKVDEIEQINAELANDKMEGEEKEEKGGKRRENKN